jgi:hypothetical protein
MNLQDKGPHKGRMGMPYFHCNIAKLLEKKKLNLEKVVDRIYGASSICNKMLVC